MGGFIGTNHEMATVWDPASRTPSGNVTISGANNLTASFAGSLNTSVCSSSTQIVGVSGGKFMFEITVGTMAIDFAVGIADGSYLAGGTELGQSIHSIGAYVDSVQQGLVFFNGAQAPFGGSGFTCTTGDVVSVCVDTINSIFWFTSPEMRTAWGSTAWNNSTSTVPGGTGASFSGLGTPVTIVFNDDNLPASCTLNTGATAFNQTIPSGFVAWDSSVVATGKPFVIWMD
jgi:hypothetical protein